jgi:ribosome-associated protein
MSIPSTTRNLVLAAYAACEEKKALNARILELDPAESAFTDVFLICSGANPRQVQAIADEVELRLKREFGMYANSVEGYRTAKWILLDYVDFVVHVFDEETRALYDIERLRKTASSVTLEDWKRPLVAKVAAVRAGAKQKTAAKKKSGTKSGTKSGAKSASGKPSKTSGASRGRATKKSTGKPSASKKARASRPSASSKKKAAKKTASARPAKRTGSRPKAHKRAGLRVAKKKTVK